jgi:dienelactone hydrolase
MRRLTVARDGLYAQWYAPTDLKRDMPPVVVFGGSNGGYSEGPFAAAFASYGYPALALAYFKGPGLPHQLRRIPLEYFKRAIQFVRRQTHVSRVVVCGPRAGARLRCCWGRPTRSSSQA